MAAASLRTARSAHDNSYRSPRRQEEYEANGMINERRSDGGVWPCSEDQAENQKAGAIFGHLEIEQAEGVVVYAIDASRCDSNQSDEGARADGAEHSVASEHQVKVTAAP
ncbi:hypothetical protein EYF80_016405 [Liparis tanakae]|uniref:Uncharacterized protein n=1 Tax=Liparis tanakae TaxID=230148 RepID=A0A4Z2I6S2_9TELE|nr:hypothetical protein EYF80_016405 [Liparis tanakae]